MFVPGARAPAFARVFVRVQASADNCEMTDEDALLDYCLSKNLITLGWIHVSERAHTGALNGAAGWLAG